jgi:mono/diheme cytochrome c family protein
MRRALGILVVILLAGCTRSNMDSQPKYHEYEPGRLFSNGRVLQAPPAGTVARDDGARAEEIRQRPALTPRLLARGREQYNVYCSPCHDRTGSGRGIVVQRGMPEPASLHDQRLRDSTDQRLFDVISNGYGAMYAHGDRIRPRDRWAIVAYIRALQLSQHATVADLPSDVRTRMTTETPDKTPEKTP